MNQKVISFISSKFKLFLCGMGFIVGIAALVLSIIAIFNCEIFRNNEDMFLKTFIFFLGISIFWLLWICFIVWYGIQTISVITMYEDRFMFRSLFSQKEVLFQDIKNIYEINLGREGDVFFIETKDATYNLMQMNYPFKFDCNPKTRQWIQKIWDKEVKKGWPESS